MGFMFNCVGWGIGIFITPLLTFSVFQVRVIAHMIMPAPSLEGSIEIVSMMCEGPQVHKIVGACLVVSGRPVTVRRGRNELQVLRSNMMVGQHTVVYTIAPY